MKIRLITLLTLMLICKVEVTASNLPKDEALPAYIFEQRGDAYGRSRTTISDVGFKLQILDSDTCVIANAPTWRVMFFNTVTKKCLAMSFEDWLKHAAFTTYSGRDWDRTKLLVVKPQATSRFNLSARLFSVAGYATPKGYTPHPKLGFGDYVDVVNLVDAPQPIAIMQKCLSTPFSSGAPLELLNHSPAGKLEAFHSAGAGDQTYLHTLSLRRGTALKSFFAYPESYTPERSEVKILNDPTRRRQSDDVLKELLP